MKRRTKKVKMKEKMMKKTKEKLKGDQEEQLIPLSGVSWKVGGPLAHSAEGPSFGSPPSMVKAIPVVVGYGVQAGVADMAMMT